MQITDPILFVGAIRELPLRLRNDMVFWQLEV